MISIVVTARASYARVQTVCEALTRTSVAFEIAAGGAAVVPRYGRVVDVMRAHGFAAVELPSVVEGETLETGALSAGVALDAYARYFYRQKPDLAVVIGDRREVLSAAMAASYQNIPLMHLLGGERSGSIDDKIRFAITALADYHAVPHEKAFGRVCAVLHGDNQVRLTGCPSMDLALRAISARQEIPENRYGVVIVHPDTRRPELLRDWLSQAVAFVRQRHIQVVMFHPAEDPGAITPMFPNVAVISNLSADRFYQLLHGADCIVGNSSVLVRECAALGWSDKITLIGGMRQDGRDVGVSLGNGTAGQQIADWIGELCESQTRHAAPESGRTDRLAGSRV